MEILFVGKTLQVLTDKKSSRHLLHQWVTTPDQQNWLVKLLYDFEIIYKPGTTNKAADALSRKEEEGELCAVSRVCCWLESEQLQETVGMDPKLKQIIIKLKESPEVPSPFLLNHGLLFYKDRVVIPSNEEWVNKLIEDCHLTPMGWHSRAYRTIKRLTSSVYWIGMKSKVHNYVAQCEISQKQKYQATSPARLVQPLPIPERIWKDIVWISLPDCPNQEDAIQLWYG